jgi:hypothetical protein
MYKEACGDMTKKEKEARARMKDFINRVIKEIQKAKSNR